MRKPERTFALTVAFVAALLVTSTLYARDDHVSSGSTIRDGTLGQRSIGPTSQMMDSCASMMQSRSNDGRRPNEQWRKQIPRTPERKS